ncbi:MAG TPA: DUF438 domain-containing protein [Polyangia bacterium]
MRLTLSTKIHDLVTTYPFLVDFLAGYAPEFGKLRSPVARATLGRVASVQMAARMGKLDAGKLLGDIAAAIARETGTAPETGAAAPPTPAEWTARREVLKGIIRDLHAGQTAQDLKSRFDLLLADVGPTEIGRMENEIIAEGTPAAEVRRLCDLHVEVFRGAFAQQATPVAPAGHPVHTFMAENRVLEQVLGMLGNELSALGTPPDPAAWPRHEERVLAGLAQLATVEKHYVRKEHLLFPLLEKNGVSGPSQVMWAVHDDIRAQLKAARAAAALGDVAALAAALPALLREAGDMVFKEENVLLPMCLELLTEADWVAVRGAEAEIGYALVEPGDEWRPAAAAPAAEPRALSRLPLDTGLLSLEQVNLLLGHLPLEVSFVDENDEVRYYSGGEKRIFPRTPQVIGRKVQNCHPPKSLHMVNRILEEFRAGRRDAAEFWITMAGRFLHIRYFAMRNADQQYRGTLEVTQDVTGIRALEGQRRLLDWD